MMKDEILEDFHAVRFNENAINIITVYRFPLDYPNHFVARLFILDEATGYIIVKDSLEEIFKSIPQRFTHLPRNEHDDEKIVCTFI